ncbi:hypothetical protein [Actinomadura rayongensis]|uniref:ATP/GTP-binding protein n=2 Tax=Actinomadura rayongensis TaxID=1429076 RepID=A0A6I4W2N9_9ACTN|nr:hypothetical protein [Actinomadura rayongensis]MXQ62980.1 hypothetical protein [Actinomadura rayongensis]
MPTADWARVLRAETPLPVPVVHTAPKNRSFVELRTALWVDGFRTVHTRPLNLPNRRIQATGTPVSVRWQLGETEITCTGPGTRDGKSCGYTYRRASTGQPGGHYKITATIIWDFHWTCVGSACGTTYGDLDQGQMTSQPVGLVVDEIQSKDKQ